MIAARSRPRHPAVPGYAHRGLLARETAARSHLLAGHTRARQTRRPSPNLRLAWCSNYLSEAPTLDTERCRPPVPP